MVSPIDKLILIINKKAINHEKSNVQKINKRKMQIKLLISRTKIIKKKNQVLSKGLNTRKLKVGNRKTKQT